MKKALLTLIFMFGFVISVKAETYRITLDNQGATTSGTPHIYYDILRFVNN